MRCRCTKEYRLFRTGHNVVGGQTPEFPCIRPVSTAHLRNSRRHAPACRKTQESAEQVQKHALEQSGLHLPTRAFISRHTPDSDVPIIAVKHEEQMKKTHFTFTRLSFLRPMMKPSKANIQETE